MPPKKALAKPTKSPGARVGKRATITSAVTLQALLDSDTKVGGLLADVPAKDRVNVTPLRRAVWAAVSAVPKGRVGTYASIGYAAKWLMAAQAKQAAAALNGTETPTDLDVQRPKGLFAQAVGQALRNNPVAPMVPCHRCVRTDGTIGGFSGAVEGANIERKVAILRSEGVSVLRSGANVIAVTDGCVLEC